MPISAAWPAAKPRSPQPLEQRILVTATLCLLAAGTVMVYSATSARTVLQGHGSGTGYLVKYLAYALVGLVAMRLVGRGGLTAVARATPLLLAISFALVLAAHVPHVGVTVNGARRWIGFGPLQFQPSELMKLSLVLYTCGVLAKHPRRVHSLRAMRPALIMIGSGVVLVATQPDLGTALVIAFAIVALLVIAGMGARELGILAGVAVATTLAYSLASPYRAHRLTSFVNPWAHASGTGFQAVQGQIAIGSGGLLGKGPGQSVQKIFYLPEAHTDFILAVIGEELGLVGIGGLLFLYALIAYAGMRAAKAARDPYAKLLAAGLTSMIVCQALLNVFAVLGVAPLTGVPLPFVSYGASNLVILLAAMGVLTEIASGAGRRLRAIDGRAPRGTGRSDAPGLKRERTRTEDPDRRRRDGGARRAGPRGRGRAAG